MSDGRYLVDPREASDVRADLRRAAERTPVPGRKQMWSDLLFDASGAFTMPAEPSQVLLQALIELHPGLAAHVSALPAAARRDWLIRILGIPRLPVAPDRVAVSVVADPSAVPVVLPARTPLRGGRDAAKGERRYETLDVLTVHGAVLQGVLAYEARGPKPTETAATWNDRDAPFMPFPGSITPAHTCRFSSPLLAFEGQGGEGTMSVTLTFAKGDARLLRDADWRCSSPDSPVTVATRDSSPVAITLTIGGRCLPAIPGELPWIEVELSKRSPLRRALGFTFERVTIAARREGVLPEAAFCNDGLLDVSREFQPFGPVPRRGDAFYLRCDEAFGKPLAAFKVSFGLAQGASKLATVPVSQLGQYWTAGYKQAHQFSILYGGIPAGGTQKKYEYTLEPGDFPTVAGTLPAALRWQRHAAGRWTDVGVSGSSTAFGPFEVRSGLPSREAASDDYALGGGGGRFIRAFLASGDFGWSAYQLRVATFAAAAAGAGKLDPDDLLAPEPPVASEMTISYETAAVPVAAVTATSGWSSRRWSGTGAFRPFELPLAQGSKENAAMVAIGLTVAAASLGSSVSVFVVIVSASACSGATAGQATWECWTHSGWQQLEVIDGTRGLRQSGLLRFVAPGDWEVGSPDLSAEVGRWIRMRTPSPASVGTIRAILPDAVEAEYVSRLPRPEEDPTPLTPLAAGEIKGLVTPVVGVKKAVNLPGTPGRGPEEDTSYVRRASGMARHRRRAVQPWDYEELASVEFPEIAAARCLPHTAQDGSSAPGWVGLVVLPHSTEPQPAPTVTLVERLSDRLAPMMPVHARLAVLCPDYVEVTVAVGVQLARGVAALSGKQAITSALDQWLHPLGTLPPRFGRRLYASEVAAFLESLPEVDHLYDFALLALGAPTEVVDTDPCRGLTASSGAHAIAVREAL